MNVTLDSPSDSLFGLRSDNQKGYIGTICGPFWPGVGSFESLSGGRSVGMVWAASEYIKFPPYRGISWTKIALAGAYVHRLGWEWAH